MLNLLTFFTFGLLYTAKTDELKTNTAHWYDMLLPLHYNKFQAPSIAMYNKGLTMVNCVMNPTTIIRVSPKTMDMEIEMAFYISWRDSRLNQTVLKRETNPYTIFPKSLASQMWFPILNFGNCKACSSITLYKPNKATLFYNHIKSETYSWVRRVETVICKLEMTRYPFDKQICSVQIKSFSSQPISVNYTIDQPNLNIINVPPEWVLLEFTSTDCSLSSEIDPAHNSCHYYNFILLRTRVRSILLILIPSILIVVISWISFWLPPSYAAPRVALGLTSMLTLATQFNSAQRDLPSVSTLMALDVWMFSCILVVFISLIEYSVVAYLDHFNHSNVVSPASTSFSTPSITNITKQRFNKSRCDVIDKTSRLVFPLIFLIFNLYFWTYYCY